MNYFKLAYSGDQINEAISAYIDERYVPINDIYECFKTYWNAIYINEDLSEDNYKNYKNPFIYKAEGQGYLINIDGNKKLQINLSDGLINNIGERNGIWFKKSDDKEGHIPLYAFSSDPSSTNINDYTLIKQPINDTSLITLCMLGIPYKLSKYMKQDLTEYDISTLYKDDYDTILIKNSFNVYGKENIINSNNYKAYFTSDRLLKRFEEIGKIKAINNLNEIKQGDILFECNTTNGTVTQVSLVLYRLSYNNSNEKQPLFLLAKASETGDVIQTYYGYNNLIEDKNLIICRPKYHRLTPNPYRDISFVNKNEINIEELNDCIKIELIEKEEDEKKIITLEYDWKPKANDSYLKFSSNNIEILSHYIPNNLSDCQYKKIRVVLPINSYVYSSLMSSDDKTNNIIQIEEFLSTNTANGKPILDNIILYDGIKLNEY